MPNSPRYAVTNPRSVVGQEEEKMISLSARYRQNNKVALHQFRQAQYGATLCEGSKLAQRKVNKFSNYADTELVHITDPLSQNKMS